MGALTFSDLQLHGSSAVEAALRMSADQAVAVVRHGAEDLVLTTASRAAQARGAFSVTSRLLVELMQQPAARDSLTAVIPEVFPWAAFLSSDEMREFVAELVSTMGAAESLDDSGPLVEVIDAWRHTAEVLADPELAAVLSAPSNSDFGSVPEPGRS